METHSDSLLRGREIIRRYVERLPGTPGVYRMIDAKGNALYIGKAKHLKNRVSSYLNVGAQSFRMQQAIAQTAGMDITTTRSEAEALLLEANLVKKLSPRYNMLLKDDKSFPYILIDDHAYPRVAKYRGAKTKKGKYFGPFTSGLAVNETITFLQKAFLLRPCSDNVFKNRSRPCLQYQIKRCSAPCVEKISRADYAKLVKQAEDFLTGKSTDLQDTLIEEMQEHSYKMHYEKARVVRDRLKALATVQQQGAGAAEIGDADIIALARDRRSCCIQLFSYRGGRNWGNRAWFPEHTEEMSDSDIVSQFLGRYYQTQIPPGLVLVSHLLEDATVLEEALRLRADYKVEILQPIRGPKRELMNEARRNAEEALARHLALKTTQRTVLEGVQTLFALEEPPRRIEVYDNSHISGTHAVGAMIVAGPDGFQKSEYRKFNIKNDEIVPGDDYAMMREVLARRFRRLEETEEEQDESKVPSLVLIDGGAGQLSVAVKVLEEAGTQGVTVAAIAKGPDRNAGREQFFLPGKKPFQLSENDAVLHYLQRLRDEAHRFAIGTHRAKRSKALHVSELDAIAGVGPTRKKALLLHFGSARAVSAASLEEIQKVPGISRTTAKLIYAHFHGEA